MKCSSIWFKKNKERDFLTYFKVWNSAAGCCICGRVEWLQKALRYIWEREIHHKTLNTEMLGLLLRASEAQMVRKQTHSEKGP